MEPSTFQRGGFLYDRARRFLRLAQELFKRAEYDFSAFNLEQSAQLFLKYALWKKLGDFEKTHSIERLLKHLEKASPPLKEGLETWRQQHKETIQDLEVTYLESRYLPAQFFKEQVEKMIVFVQELKEKVDTECGEIKKRSETEEE